MGNGYYYQKNYQKAIDLYKQCLAVAPGYKDATNNLPVAYRDLGRYYGEQKNDLPNSIRALEESYKLRPDDIETIRLLGVAYGIGQNHAKAIEYFSKITEKQPNNAQAFYDLGTAYLNMGNIAKSQEMRQKAIQLEPKLGEQKK
jgi:tetratricopeptide (TPR) repeat protein